MSQKVEEANEILDNSMEAFKKRFNDYSLLMANITEKAKKQNENLRDQINRITESVTQLQKKTDFNNLEKQV